MAEAVSSSRHVSTKCHNNAFAHRPSRWLSRHAFAIRRIFIRQINVPQGFLRNHPLLAQRTKFTALLAAVTAISFCWFIGP